MIHFTAIQAKALVLLLSFAASFTVFCHCEAHASTTGHHSCCEKKTPEPNRSHGCQGMNAIHFNLQAKQLSAPVHMDALPVVVLSQHIIRQQKPLSLFTYPSIPSPGDPPDCQALYQCFRI